MGWSEAMDTNSKKRLSMNAAFTIFAKKVGREWRISFEVSASPFYSEQNMLRLRKFVAQLETSGGQIHEVNLANICQGEFHISLPLKKGAQNQPAKCKKAVGP